MTTQTIPLEAEKPAAPEAEVIKVPGIRVDLLADHVMLHMADGIMRRISYEAFSNFLLTFQGKVEAETEKGFNFKLPANTYAIEMTKTGMKVGMYVPGEVREVTYLTSRKPRVTPNVIVTVLLTGAKEEKWRTSKAFYFCTSLSYQEFSKDIILGPDVSKKISTLPFSNVYQDGQLCFGGNAFPQNFPKGDLRQLRQFYDVLWSSPFNNDLGVRALRNGNFTVESWYENLAKLAADGKPFPYNNLDI